MVGPSRSYSFFLFSFFTFLSLSPVTPLHGTRITRFVMHACIITITEPSQFFFLCTQRISHGTGTPPCNYHFTWPISLLVWAGCVALAYLLGSGFPYGILLLSNKSFAVDKKKNMPKEGLEIENMADILGKEFEMVLIVRNDIKMNGGKIAAQCSHAALGLYKELLCRAPKSLNRWERCGQRQVVVKIESENDMLVLQVSSI